MIFVITALVVPYYVEKLVIFLHYVRKLELRLNGKEPSWHTNFCNKAILHKENNRKHRLRLTKCICGIWL